MSSLTHPAALKVMLAVFVVLAGLTYLFGTNGASDVLASSVGDSGSSTSPLATYGGGPWQGQLSYYPAGHGAIPYNTMVTLGGSQIQGPDLYGGTLR